MWTLPADARVSRPRANCRADVQTALKETRLTTNKETTSKTQ